MVLEMTPEHKVHCRYLSITFKKSAKIYIDFDILPVIIFWYPHKERCKEKKKNTWMVYLYIQFLSLYFTAKPINFSGIICV